MIFFVNNVDIVLYFYTHLPARTKIQAGCSSGSDTNRIVMAILIP